MSYLLKNKGPAIDKAIYHIKRQQKNIDLINNINNIDNNIKSEVQISNNDIEQQKIVLQQNYNEAVSRLHALGIDEEQSFELSYPIGVVYTCVDGKDPNTLFPNSKWEELEIDGNLTDNEIINAYYNTNDINITTASDGSKWYKIFAHDSNSGGTVFANYGEALRCRKTDKFSDLWLLRSNTYPFLNENGEYEFALQYYDKSADYNRWRQTSNPFHGAANTVQGYTPIHIGWASNFGGLSRKNANITTASNCFLSCQSSTSWWYAIAPYKAYEGGMPGPYIGSTATVITSRLFLWIRVPKLEQDNLISKKLNIKYYKRIS